MTKKQLLDKLVLILESEDANNTLTFETALEQYIRSKENILSPSTIREDTVYFSETLTIILTILHCQKSMN